MTTATELPAQTRRLTADVVVVGGGTAGTMAAITAAERGASVLLLEKAHVRHSGALAMGMDGVNNAVIPGKATPEDYVAEITRANDGIVNQRTIRQTATRGYDMVRRLESYGVKFEKDEYGEYHVRRVHRSGSYVLPMPEGKDIKKVLYRVLRRREMRERITIENRVMPVRVLTDAGRAVGVAGFHTRTGDFVEVSAGAVILATGACGRLGLPASGYLYGTYENPTNAGDGYAMAYHAGAELSGIECFQINPLIKDYNGPACAYVANPFGGYQVNNRGERFVDCDYWSGQMMAEVAREISSERGPIYLKLTHLPDESIFALKSILHTTERPTRGTFHAGRGHDYHSHDVEMHISEIGLCSGHSASGVWVDENGATTVPGLYAAGDLACVPHNYMIGAFVFGDLAGAHATGWAAENPVPETLPAHQIEQARELIYRPLRNPDGPPQPQVEYKLRRFVNDYVAPPKSEAKLRIAVETFARMEDELAQMGARNPHELMRCVEVTFIRDCAEMAARSSLMRTESRWGLYHDHLDHPVRDDRNWMYHLNLRKRDQSGMQFLKRPINEYVVPVPEFTLPDKQDVQILTDLTPDSGFLRTREGDSLIHARSAPAGNADRILKVLALAEEQPALEQVEPYLRDADHEVRRAAVTTLTETAPAGVGLALVGMLTDRHPVVRHAAASGLRELTEVLPRDAEIATVLTERLSSADAVVRSCALELLRILKLGTSDTYGASLTDSDTQVRLDAVRGAISLNAADLLTTAATDSSREVRVVVAGGIGTVGDQAATAALEKLTYDEDVLVRAAALAASVHLATPALVDRAVAALDDLAWQVRRGAAEGLGSADGAPAAAKHALIAALRDEHLDVRKAAVRSLSAWVGDTEADDALRAALTDLDADVRAFARQAVGSA